MGSRPSGPHARHLAYISRKINQPALQGLALTVPFLVKVHINADRLLFRSLDDVSGAKPGGKENGTTSRETRSKRPLVKDSLETKGSELSTEVKSTESKRLRLEDSSDETMRPPPAKRLKVQGSPVFKKPATVSNRYGKKGRSSSPIPQQLPPVGKRAKPKPRATRAAKAKEEKAELQDVSHEDASPPKRKSATKIGKMNEKKVRLGLIVYVDMSWRLTRCT